MSLFKPPASYTYVPPVQARAYQPYTHFCQPPEPSSGGGSNSGGVVCGAGIAPLIVAGTCVTYGGGNVVRVSVCIYTGC